MMIDRMVWSQLFLIYNRLGSMDGMSQIKW